MVIASVIIPDGYWESSVNVEYKVKEKRKVCQNKKKR